MGLESASPGDPAVQPCPTSQLLVQDRRVCDMAVLVGYTRDRSVQGGEMLHSDVDTGHRAEMPSRFRCMRLLVAHLERHLPAATPIRVRDFLDRRSTVLHQPVQPAFRPEPREPHRSLPSTVSGVRPVAQRVGSLTDPGVEAMLRHLTRPRRHVSFHRVEVLPQAVARPRQRRRQSGLTHPCVAFRGAYRQVVLHLPERPVEREPGSTQIVAQHLHLRW